MKKLADWDVLGVMCFIQSVMNEQANREDIRYLGVCPKGKLLALADKMTPEEEKEIMKWLDELPSINQRGSA